MKNFIASFVGGLVGAFLFLVFATYFFGHPFSDWFMSAHGILFAAKERELSYKETLELYRLMQQGLVVTPDSLISTISSLYGNVIQVLIGVLAGATLLAFFAVRWQSVQAAQEYVDKKVDDHFGSAEFVNKLNGHIEYHIDTLDPATNPQLRVTSTVASVEELHERIDRLEMLISQAASPEETEEEGEPIEE